METLSDNIPGIVSFIAILITAVNLWASRKIRSATVHQKKADAFTKQAEGYSKLIADLQVSYDRSVVRIGDLEETCGKRIRELERELEKYKKDLSATKGRLTRTKNREVELSNRIEELERQFNGQPKP